MTWVKTFICCQNFCIYVNYSYILYVKYYFLKRYNVKNLDLVKFRFSYLTVNVKS